jgi:hypothetical protein
MMSVSYRHSILLIAKRTDRRGGVSLLFVQKAHARLALKCKCKQALPNLRHVGESALAAGPTQPGFGTPDTYNGRVQRRFSTLCDNSRPSPSRA